MCREIHQIHHHTVLHTFKRKSDRIDIQKKIRQNLNKPRPRVTIYYMNITCNKQRILTTKENFSISEDTERK